MADNRRYLQRLLQRRIHGRAPDSELTAEDIARISEKSGIAKEDLATVLQGKDETEQDFIRLSQAQHKVSLVLSGGEKND